MVLGQAGSRLKAQGRLSVRRTGIARRQAGLPARAARRLMSEAKPSDKAPRSGRLMRGVDAVTLRC